MGGGLKTTVISNTFHLQKCQWHKFAKIGGIHIVRPLNLAVQLIKCRSKIFFSEAPAAQAREPLPFFHGQSGSPRPKAAGFQEEKLEEATCVPSP